MEMYDQDLGDLDEEDFIEIYEEIINFRPTDKAKERTTNLLIRIHQLGMIQNEYALPWLADWSHLKGYAQVSMVNARIIDHRYISAAAVYLKEHCTRDDDYENLYWILSFGFRLGLRIGEILKIQIKDIDNTVIYIRSNKFGDGKSISARRKVTFSQFLSETEFQNFNEFRTKRSKRCGRETSSLLFAGIGGRKIKSTHISNLIGVALKQVTGDDNMKFHNLRHSAANVFHCIAEKHYLLAEQLSGLPEARLINIRMVFAGVKSRYRDVYFGVSCFLGHAHPTHTMSSYLHLASKILFQNLTKNIHASTYGLISQFTGLRKDSLKKSKTVNQLCGRLIKHYKPSFLTKSKSDLNEAKIPDAPDQLTAKVVGFFKIFEILKALEEGYSIKVIASIFSVENNDVERWQKNARELHQIVTREKVSRLFSKERFLRVGENGPLKELLTPGVRNSRSEFNDMEIMVRKLQEKNSKEFSNKIYKVSWEIANSYTTTHSHLKFSSTESIRLLMDVFSDVIAKKRWRVHIFIYDGVNKNNQINMWKEAFPKGVKFNRPNILKDRDRVNYPDGFIHLTLEHTFVKEIVEKANNLSSYSTNNLVNLAHMFLIIMKQ